MVQEEQVEPRVLLTSLIVALCFSSVQGILNMSANICSFTALVFAFALLPRVAAQVSG